jgi:hypothetical protein
VHCTTPYPVLVRECIEQIIDKVKVEFPENLIKVSVDCTNQVFKVARKEKGTGGVVLNPIQNDYTNSGCGAGCQCPLCAGKFQTRLAANPLLKISKCFL